MKKNYTKNIIENFKKISKIPRQSGDEAMISNYIKEYAKKFDHDVYQDEYNNLIIKQLNNPENKTIILQGHLDMVYETNDSSSKEYKDGIKLDISEDTIKGVGTSIGADNGIAIAYFMELMKMKNDNLPNIEYVLTVEEEVGLTGASNLDVSNLKGRTMINLDTEDEGIFIVSCAGGIRNRTYIDIERTELNKDNWETLKIFFNSSKGGHSGLDIDENRINAIKASGKLLYELVNNFNIKLGDIKCDGKANAIPKKCEFVIAIEKINQHEIKKHIENFVNNMNRNFTNDDILEAKINNNNLKHFYNDNTRDKIINFINLYPNGPLSYNKDLDYLVQTSANLGAIEEKENKLILLSSIRSSNKLEKYEVVDKIKIVSKILNIKSEFFNDYPQWEYKSESKIRDICLNEYENLYNKKGKVSAIHAGLECGYFDSKIKNIDMISMGPNIYNPHTTEEYISIKSVDRMWKFLLQVLQKYSMDDCA
ncbi:MAG: beta-Ala-His dipeptidase [Bacillota bacterium]|nr:beta-Ala-His dipeptidase [Bacillota bacterium]